MENIIKTRKNKRNTVDMPQRKRLTVDEVYIQDVNGKLWEIRDWDGSVKPNAIAVITPQHKFRIALTSKHLQMHPCFTDPWEEKLESINSGYIARADGSGAYNTRQILNLQPSRKYAAGWCNAYKFPDGITKGYLPAAGELYLAYRNKDRIDWAVEKCGCAKFGGDIHLSSTFAYVDAYARSFWGIDLVSGAITPWHLSDGRYVRPFAALEI